MSNKLNIEQQNREDIINFIKTREGTIQLNTTNSYFVRTILEQL